MVDPPPIESPPLNHIAAAFKYKADIAKVENSKVRKDGIKFNEKDGRPLPMDEEEIKASLKILWDTPVDSLEPKNRQILPKVQGKLQSETPLEVEDETLRKAWVKRAFQHAWEGDLLHFELAVKKN